MVNEYSPFNRWKGLFHIAEMRAIVDGKFLPPYWVAVDPSNACNQNCNYCNSSIHRRETGAATMPGGHLLRIADFIKDWGVKSCIIEGGGEPLMGEKVPQFLEKLYRYDIHAGLVTNASKMDETYWELLPFTCKWVGISVDSAAKETYKKIRGTNDFDKVIENIAGLCANRGNLDVRMKLLIQPENYLEIVDFVKLAKDCGCSGAHIKPLSLENVEGHHVGAFDLPFEKIERSIEQAKKLQDDNFVVDCVTYKHDVKFKRIVKFDRCRCTPLGGVFGSGGNFWLCYNMRGREGFNLCGHFPDPWNVKRIWGTEYHKKLIKGINPQECMRCGLTQYNEMIEKCVERDLLFREFP